MKSRNGGQRRTVGTEASAAVDWRAAYEDNAPDLLAFLRRTTGNLSNAEDLLQETFARAMRAGSRTPTAGIRRWLFRIAANLAISQHRRQLLIAFLPMSGEQPGDTQAFDVEAEHVRAALRSIPRDQAVTLTLALHDGFTRHEIAEMLETSEEAIKSRLARGRRNFAAAYRRLERGLSG